MKFLTNMPKYLNISLCKPYASRRPADEASLPC